MKRFLSLLICCCILTSQLVYAEEMQRFLTDGNIHLEFEGAQGDEEVMVIVTPEDKNWFDETQWRNGVFTDELLKDDDNLIWFDTVTADANGKYAVDVFVDKMGIYNAVAGNKAYKFKYTNLDANRNAIKSVKEAKSSDEVYAILNSEDGEQALCLDDPIFAQIKADTKLTDNELPLVYTAELLYKEFAAGGAPEENDPKTVADKFNAAVYKACLVTMVNGRTENKINNIDDYIDYVNLKELKFDKYYNKKTAGYITSLLGQSEIDSLEKFDARLFESILLANIRYNDNTSSIVSMLSDFSKEIGITKTDHITDAVIRTMVGNTYQSIDEVVKYINEYTPLQNGGSRGGSSGSAMGSGTRGPTPSERVISSELTDTGEQLVNRNVFADTNDVPWALEAINTLAMKGIVAGRTQTEFVPNDFITREEFVKLVVTSLSLNVVGDDMAFEDVSEDDWFYAYVRSAYNAEIINGISNTEFGTGQHITRQDLAVIVARAAYIAGVEFEEKNEAITFTDAENISDYAVESVSVLQRTGVLTGDGTGAFKPNDNATRAEAAKVVYMIYRHIK